MPRSATARFAQSADGTAIAYETCGRGTPLIAVGGMGCDRKLMRPTTQVLGERFRAVNYDRRGRGDSGDTPPYAIQREVEDVAALIEEVGEPVFLYGHSSGAGLVLHAVAAGLPVERFILHDPPYSPDDEASREEARAFGELIRNLLGDEQRGPAIEAFFRATGLPDGAIEETKKTARWSELEALAPTLVYDSEVMGDLERGGAIPAELGARARRPGLVLLGSESPPFMLEVGRQLADLLPHGDFRMIEGQGHVADPHELAPIVADFLLGDGRQD